MKLLRIEIDRYGQFVVTFEVTREDAWAAYVRLLSAKSHRFFDGDDDFASFDPRDDVPGVTIIWNANACFVRFDGFCRSTGDARLERLVFDTLVV